jgi:hypothetical protein
MKTIKFTDISAILGARFKSGMLDWLQSAPKELIQVVVKMLIGIDPTSTNVYVLYGCVNTGAGSTYVISEGAIYYQGEIFKVPSTTFLITTGVAVAKIIETSLVDLRHDPVTFQDGSTKNIHIDRTVEISEALSGSGIANYVDFRIPTLNHVGYLEKNTLRTGSSGAPLLNGLATANILFSFTTPNDGISRDYSITLTSIIANDIGTNPGGLTYWTELKNGSTSLSVQTAHIEDTRICHTHNFAIAKLPPNTTIDIYDYRSGGTDGEVGSSKLSYIGVRS